MVCKKVLILKIVWSLWSGWLLKAKKKKEKRKHKKTKFLHYLRNRTRDPLLLGQCTCHYTTCPRVLKEKLIFVEGVELCGTHGTTILTVKLLRTTRKEYANEQGTPSDIFPSYFLLLLCAKSLLTWMTISALSGFQSGAFSRQNKNLRRVQTSVECSLGYFF